MYLQIVSRDGRLSTTLRESIQERVLFAFRRFAERIAHVVVHLEDLNGPKGGVDQLCRIDVSLVHSGAIRARATGANTMTAVGEAGERVARQLRNRLGRRRALRQRSACHRHTTVSL